jgi:aspartyl-tRNA(Asn)/glutamyl-tRNA(Gln) amidotransferase subunit C
MDRKELLLTAELAALRPTEAELDRLGAEVEKMLAYFASLAEVDTAGLEATTHAHVDANRLRPDAAASGAAAAAAAVADAMLDQAPDLEGRLIVIPNVL